MAKIPPLRRLAAEDFKDQSGWIGSLLTPINTFFEQTIAALNKGLTLSDNMAGTILTVQLDGTFPKNIAWSLPNKPVSVLVGNVVRADGTPYPTFLLTSAVQVQWQYNQAGQLEIDAVTGIAPTPALQYILTLEVKTG